MHSTLENTTQSATDDWTVEHLAAPHDLVNLAPDDTWTRTDAVVDIMLGFLVRMPDPTRVREPIPA